MSRDDEQQQKLPPEETAGDDWENEPVEFAVTDVLDLHSFPPREVKELVADYLELALERGYARVRIIHGRGTGVQRRMVRAQLERHPRVVSYGDAPAEAGGWGATWAELDLPEASDDDASGD